MRIAIIEDNAAEAEQLRRKTEALLPKTCLPAFIDVYPSGAQFLKKNLFYELLLIDCLLPDMSGVELAKMIREKNRNSAVIFTTAYLEYASEGYETDALRYLLKPVQDEKLKEALESFARLETEDPVIELTGTTRHAVFTKASKILYVEYVNRRVVVRLEGNTVETQKTITQFEQTLSSDRFFRTSRHFLVNFQHITGKEQNMLIMRNGEHVAISRRKVVAFNHAYIHYLKQS
ncbi:MAG: response regulator transcription factor [Clostridia bacterium]|nr:response regulator transcription factor [Clostridia bacterium]